MSFTLVNEKLFTWEKLDHATQILPIAKEIDSWREASEEDFYSLFSLSEMYSTWQLCAKVFYVSVPHRNGLSVDLIQKSYDRKLKHKKLTSV